MLLRFLRHRHPPLHHGHDQHAFARVVLGFRLLRGLVGRKGRRSEPTKKKTETAPAIEVAGSPGPPWLRLVLGIAGALYIVGVFIEGAGGGRLDRIVPRPLLFFSQIAALFPRAASYRIEYRAEGLPCHGPAFEVDVRPYFPIHANDKESRFDRALHFYRNDRPTMEALETYVMDRYNLREEAKIAGMLFLSLRVPIPTPGSAFPRYERAPLADFPKEQRKVWYATSRDVVNRRCGEGDP
jgi:hypothetical protein